MDKGIVIKYWTPKWQNKKETLEMQLLEINEEEAEPAWPLILLHTGQAPKKILQFPKRIQ